MSILKLHFCHRTPEERVQIWYTDIFLSSERLICAAPAWLTPAFGHLGKPQPASAKRKNHWFLSSPAAITVCGETEVFQPCQWHLGDAAPEQPQDYLPRASQSRANAKGGQSWGGEGALCGDLPMGMGSRAPGMGPHPPGGHGAAPTHSSGFFCVLRGWFPGRNNSSEPQGLLTGSSCCCFLKITIVGGLCSFSFFLNSILSVMFQLLKWSFP